MPPVLFDTSVYISALRSGDDSILTLRQFARDSPLWLSAVVLEELYAGTGRRDCPHVEELELGFAGGRRILLPNLTDWIETGRVLARLAAKYGYEKIGRGRLTNDALIAMSAARMGVRVITANERDFRRLAEFRPFQWERIVI